jgi:hypothetical protein
MNTRELQIDRLARLVGEVTKAYNQAGVPMCAYFWTKDGNQHFIRSSFNIAERSELAGVAEGFAQVAEKCAADHGWK